MCVRACACVCLCVVLCRIQEEDDVPDDDMVNQMIGRSQEELQHFQVFGIFSYSVYAYLPPTVH